MVMRYGCYQLAELVKKKPLALNLVWSNNNFQNQDKPRILSW